MNTCYALIENDRAEKQETSFTLLMVEDLGPSREHVAQKVRAVINKEIHYVGHTYSTKKEALDSTSFEVLDHSGETLKASE